MVAQHYQCTAAEIEEMKGCARTDFENAQPCFATLAEEICAERGVNRRIRDQIRGVFVRNGMQSSGRDGAEGRVSALT